MIIAQIKISVLFHYLISTPRIPQSFLGGNAKTLMFVNFSPADYNSDETSTSLMYAARVKKIVNNASKVSIWCVYVFVCVSVC